MQYQVEQFLPRNTDEESAVTCSDNFLCNTASALSSVSKSGPSWVGSMSL